MKWLLEGAAKGDLLTFQFSGHGTQVKDTSGDEADGKDEAIIPSDYKTTGVIIDDEMHRYLVEALPPGVNLFCLMDCCHSGSGIDLPYVYKETGNTQKANFSQKSSKHLTEGNVILISGCQDDQTSADASFDGIKSGAMTNALLKCQKANEGKPTNWADFLKGIRNTLVSEKFSQVPQLSASFDFDFYEKIVEF